MHFEYQFRRHESSLILEMLRTGLSSCFVLFMRFYQYFSCSKVIGAMETCIKQSNIYLIWVTVAWCRFTLRVTSKSPRSFLITLNDDWRIIASQPYGVVTCYLLHKKNLISYPVNELIINCFQIILITSLFFLDWRELPRLQEA